MNSIENFPILRWLETSLFLIKTVSIINVVSPCSWRDVTLEDIPQKVAIEKIYHIFKYFINYLNSLYCWTVLKKIYVKTYTRVNNKIINFFEKSSIKIYIFTTIRKQPILKTLLLILDYPHQTIIKQLIMICVYNL